MKKFISLFLALTMCCSALFTPALAYEAPNDSDAYVDVRVFDSLDEYEQSLENAPSVQTSYCLLIPAIVRRGGSSRNICDIYMNVSGDILLSAIKYKRISITNGSLLNEVTYASFGNSKNYTIQNFPAMCNGSFEFGEMKLPTDVEYVRIWTVSLYGYSMNSGTWLEAEAFGTKYTVKN